MIKKLKEYIGAPKTIYLLIFSISSIILFFIVNFIFSKIQYAIIYGSTVAINNEYLRYMPKFNFLDLIFYSICFFLYIYIFLITIVLSIILTNVLTNIFTNFLSKRCEDLKGKNTKNNPIKKKVISFSKLKYLPIFLILFWIIMWMALFCELLFDAGGYYVNGYVAPVDKSFETAIEQEIKSKYNSNLDLKIDFMLGKIKDDRLCFELTVDDKMKLFSDNEINKLSKGSMATLLVTFLVTLYLFYVVIDNFDRYECYCPLCHKKGGIPKVGEVINVQVVDQTKTNNQTEIHKERRKWEFDNKFHDVEIEKDYQVTSKTAGTIKTYEHICSNCGQKFQYKSKDVSTVVVDKKEIRK